MEEQFVPYKLAVLLKEKGFNEPCFATFNPEQVLNGFPLYDIEEKMVDGLSYTWKNSKIHSANVAAPLWQQVFDWLDKKEIFCTVQVKIDKEGLLKWCPVITIVKNYEGLFTTLKPRGKKIDALTDLLNYVLTVLI